MDSASFERIWYDSFECDFCAPPKPGQWPKMHVSTLRGWEQLELAPAWWQTDSGCLASHNAVLGGG